MGGKRFDDNDEAKEKVNNRLKEQTVTLYEAGILN